MSDYKNEKIIVIDSNGLGYSCLYSMGKMRTSKGDLTGIIFGFLSSLIYYSEMFDCNQFIFCWDSQHSLRKELFPEYKSKRTLTQEQRDIRERAHIQFKRLRTEILPYIGFKNNVIQSGYEADDHIMKLVQSNLLHRFMIISTDEDLYQCLFDNVRIYQSNKKRIMSPVKFEDLYGIPFWEWGRVKTLGGCTSDKVPGLPRVGEDTALKFIIKERERFVKSKGYYTTDEIERFKNTPLHKIMQMTHDYKKELTIYKKLVTLPFEGTQTFKFQKDCFSIPNFIEICKSYEFKSFVTTDKETWKKFFRSKQYF